MVYINFKKRLSSNITTRQTIISSLFGLYWRRRQEFETKLGGDMRARSISTRWVLVVGAILSLAISGFADTIHLKDGGVIKGRIVSFISGQFVVNIGDGSHRRQMSFLASEIESIQFDSIPDTTTGKTNIYQPPIVNTRSNDKPAAIKSNVYTKPEVKPAPPSAQTQTSQTPPKQNPAPVVKQPVKTAPELTKPVELNVSVHADNTSNGWTNSGWVVRKGQVIHISGTGQVSLGKGTTTEPEGRPDVTDEQKLMKGVPTGALIAVIGDDNNDFIYVGGDREFTASRDGSLFLGLNEGNLNDNSGTFAVKIEIKPGNN
jgi:hypothetical protein